MWFIGGKFQLRSPESHGDALLVPPTSLAVIEAIYAAWLATFIVYCVYLGLADLRNPVELSWLHFLLVIVAGVLPIVLAWALHTNQRWARWLVPISYIATTLILAVLFSIGPWTLVVLGVACAVVCYVMLFSPDVDAYYRGLSETQSGQRNANAI